MELDINDYSVTGLFHTYFIRFDSRTKKPVRVPEILGLLYEWLQEFQTLSDEQLEPLIKEWNDNSSIKQMEECKYQLEEEKLNHLMNEFLFLKTEDFSPLRSLGFTFKASELRTYLENFMKPENSFVLSIIYNEEPQAEMETLQEEFEIASFKEKNLKTVPSSRSEEEDDKKSLRFFSVVPRFKGSVDITSIFENDQNISSKIELRKENSFIYQEEGNNREVFSFLIFKPNDYLLKKTSFEPEIPRLFSIILNAFITEGLDSEDKKNCRFFCSLDEDLWLQLSFAGQEKDVSRILEKFKRKFESFGEFLKNLGDKYSDSRKKSSNYDFVQRQSYWRNLHEGEFSSHSKSLGSLNSKSLKNDFENNLSSFIVKSKRSLIYLLNRISTGKSVVYSHGQTSKESLVELNKSLLNLRFKKVDLSDKELKRSEEKGKSDKNKYSNSDMCLVSLRLQVESPNDEHGIKSHIDGQAFIFIHLTKLFSLCIQK